MTQISTIKDNLGQLKDFLAYLATVKGDLSNITAPPFVLASKSAIEIPSAWSCHHSLFLAPASEPDPTTRALLVVKNFLVSLRQIVSDGTDDAAKKPLNPFLGELFMGEFQSGGGTKLITEQVSHHPPVTACFAYNKEHGVTSSGFGRQETSFSPTGGVTVKQIGYAVVNFERLEERHLMTMPTICVKGLTTGMPHPEFEGTSWISSSSGFVTKVQFEGKGKLGMGSKNKITATVFQTSNPDEPLYYFTGHWDGNIVLKDSKDNVVEEFDVEDNDTEEIHVKPLEAQIPWESRRAWHKVFDGIREGDIEKVNTHKTRLEESQRAMRKNEKSQGVDWKCSFFSSYDEDPATAQLLNAVSDNNSDLFDSEKTAGVWKFIGVSEAEELISRLHQNYPYGPGEAPRNNV